MVNIWLIIIWLVVEPYPSEKWWSSSIGIIIPNIWKNMFQTTNQLFITVTSPVSVSMQFDDFPSHEKSSFECFEGFEPGLFQTTSQWSTRSSHLGASIVGLSKLSWMVDFHGKIPSINGWLGVPLFQETTISSKVGCQSTGISDGCGKMRRTPFLELFWTSCSELTNMIALNHLNIRSQGTPHFQTHPNLEQSRQVEYSIHVVSLAL